MRRNPLLIIPLLVLALHGYIGLRLLPALALSPTATAAAVSVLLMSGVLVPAPFLIRLGRVPERYADALAWTGYLAMGLFSGVLVLCLLRDVVLAPLALLNVLRPGVFGGLDLQRTSALAVIVLGVSISLIGLVNARRTAKVVNVDLPIAGLPTALAGFTIVQLSDIHVGPTIKRAYLAAIVRRVNGLDADLVAITGDVIDGSVERLRDHVAPLATLRSRHGTYCVTGNHEYYHGVEAWVREWQRLGLHVLLNDNVVLNRGGERLLLGGVTDFSAARSGAEQQANADAAARAVGDFAVKILLAHQPRSATAAGKAGFDVQLSGHTHGGQFLPWNFVVPMQQPFVSGLKRLNRLLVYTSRGTGYWGPPLRFGAPSEITRLRLIRAI